MKSTTWSSHQRTQESKEHKLMIFLQTKNGWHTQGALSSPRSLSRTRHRLPQTVCALVQDFGSECIVLAIEYEPDLPVFQLDAAVSLPQSKIDDGTFVKNARDMQPWMPRPASPWS